MADWTYDGVCAAYDLERPRYKELADAIERVARDALQAHGYRIAEVSGRVKDVDSFGKKAVRKAYADPMTQIRDKAGVRVIIPFADDREVVERILDEAFVLDDRDDKRAALGPDRLGYMGVHFQCRLRSGPAVPAHLEGLEAELQLHTKAESAWAVATHDTLYKTFVDIPDPIRRRLNRLAAVVEVFDDEVERFREEVSRQPHYRVMSIVPALERLMLRFSRRPPDLGLSLAVIPWVVRAYPTGDVDEIVNDFVVPYVELHQSFLSRLYESYEDDPRAVPLLFQPEALLLLERLHNDRFRLASKWPDSIPRDLLQKLGAVVGVEVR